MADVTYPTVAVNVSASVTQVATLTKISDLNFGNMIINTADLPDSGKTLLAKIDNTSSGYMQHESIVQNPAHNQSTNGIVSLVGEGQLHFQNTSGNYFGVSDDGEIFLENLSFLEYAFGDNQWVIAGELYIDNAKIKEALKDGGTISGEAALNVDIGY